MRLHFSFKYSFFSKRIKKRELFQNLNDNQWNEAHPKNKKPLAGCGRHHAQNGSQGVEIDCQKKQRHAQGHGAPDKGVARHIVEYGVGPEIPHIENMPRSGEGQNEKR